MTDASIVGRLNASDNGALLSECGTYRYLLWRRIAPHDQDCIFVMLNPSTADASEDDPTIRKCKGFAERWGCGRLIVLNLFAYRSTCPKALTIVRDPVGLRNEWHIKEVLQHALLTPLREEKPIVICAWGKDGTLLRQDETALWWIESTGADPMCLGTNKDGTPKHPLYRPYATRPTPYVGRNLR